MGRLEQDASKFWKLMQKMRHSPFELSKGFARENELPTLAATTCFPKLAARIHREINTQEIA